MQRLRIEYTRDSSRSLECVLCVCDVHFRAQLLLSIEIFAKHTRIRSTELSHSISESNAGRLAEASKNEWVPNDDYVLANPTANSHPSESNKTK